MRYLLTGALAAAGLMTGATAIAGALILGDMTAAPMNCDTDAECAARQADLFAA